MHPAQGATGQRDNGNREQHAESKGIKPRHRAEVGRVIGFRNARDEEHPPLVAEAHGDQRGGCANEQGNPCIAGRH